MRGRVGMVATLASVVLLLAGCTGGVVSGRASLARSSTIPSPAAATCPGSDGLSGAMSDYGDRRRSRRCGPRGCRPTVRPTSPACTSWAAGSGTSSTRIGHR